MGTTERSTLHFDLGHVGPDREYTLHIGMADHSLHRHTAQSRASSREQIPLLRVIPDERLTHYADVDLPSDAIALRWVTTPKRLASGHVVDHIVHMAISIPSAGRRYARSRYGKKAGWQIHPKLKRLGVTPRELAAALGTTEDNIPAFPDHIDLIQDATDAATALLYQHPNLVNLNTDNGGSVPSTIVDTCILEAFDENASDLPLQIYMEGDAWAKTVVIGDGPATSMQPSDTVLAVATGSIQYAIRLAQDSADLAGQQWNYEYGNTSAPYDGSSDTPHSDGTLRQFSRDISVSAATGGWAARVLTPSNGLDINTGSLVYTPPAGPPTWAGTGVWSTNDTPPFAVFVSFEDAGNDTHIPDAILAGGAYLQVATANREGGLIRGQLVPQGTDAETGMTTLTARLTGDQVVPPVSTTSTGTATVTVNSGKSGMTYTVTANLDDSAPAVASLFLGAPGKDGQLVRQLPISNTTTVGSLSLECTNKWLRHLALYVQYLDAGGHVLPAPNWDEQIPDFLRSIYEPDPDKHYLDMIPPVTTVFGIPVKPDPVRITVPVWDQVSTVRFLWGGLGRGSYDSGACPMGIVTTCLAELALPVLLLVAGTAAVNTAVVKSLMADKEVLLAVCVAGGFLFAGGVATDIGTAQDPAKAIKGLAEKFGPMLLSPATSLGQWFAKKSTSALIAKAVPFVDAALMAFNAAVTAAQLAQTIIEVLDSPFVYETDVVRSLELTVSLTPGDNSYGKFPDYHTKFALTISYDVGTTLPVYVQTLPPETISNDIHVTFSSLPAGGNLNVFVAFYADNGWQSGQGQSGWAPAYGEKGTLTVPVRITTNDIPLSASSVYVHNEKIGPDSKQNLVWLPYPGKPPTQTLTSPAPYESKGKVVQRWAGITTAQAPEMIGYCWQATGLGLPPDQTGNPPSEDSMWTMQNLSVLQNPQDGWASPKVGFTSPPGIAYDLSSPNDGTGMNFFIDPTAGEFDPDDNRGGGYHARRIALSANGAPTFVTGSNQSYGRFPVAVDRYVYHPQGYLFAISYAAHKIFKLALTSTPVADKDAPQAVMCSGQGERDGLIQGPSTLAVALDGRLLVLEKLNHRIQAFDTFGKPVPYFANPGYDPNDPDSPQKIPTLAMRQGANATYLDLAVEARGYVYVLYYTGSGGKASDYQVDLYEPDGTFLVATPNVAAAGLTVNLLRNMFTLNYEQILGPGSRVQPSVSMWLPPAPAPSLKTAQA
jgi:CHRD domain